MPVQSLQKVVLVLLTAGGIPVAASAQQLEALQPKPLPKKPAAVVQAPQKSPLLVVSDLACTLQIDGVTAGFVEAEGRLLIEAEEGERLISAHGPGGEPLWRQVVIMRPGRQTAALVRQVEQRAVEAPPAPNIRNMPPGMDLVELSPGEAQVGCVPSDRRCRMDEKPRRPVSFDEPMWMTATPATVDQFAAYAAAMGASLRSQPRWARGNHPVVNVTWSEAAAFCDWVGGRLPTEAEWERAARGGNANAVYPWGDDTSRRAANYGSDACCAGAAEGADRWEQTSPVDALPSNPLGLSDMAGNVWEWTSDWYAERYGEGEQTSGLRAVRGGSWKSRLLDLRSSARSSLAPDYPYEDVGFRCILPPRP